MNPFDYVKSINEKRPVEDTTGYSPFLANTALSYSMDTVMFANEMNRYPNLPPDVQFDFLYQTVKKGKRYNKWFKEEKDDTIQLVMDYFGYSKQKAIEALQNLTAEDISKIKKTQETGGMSK